MVRIGCSGWSYEHWRGRLYPARGTTGRWLELYAKLFDTVEVNATFYRLPQAKAVARWAEATPPGFCFAVKASRYLTHVKRLSELEAGVRRFEERLEPLRAAGKLGPFLWQLPQTFQRDDDRLARALELLPPGRHAFEFRHPSWFADDVYTLLGDQGAALVVADRAPRPPTPWVDTTDWTYLRFHRGRAREGAYGREALRRWARRIEDARGDVYAYFNNDWEGFAVENARTLIRLLSHG
ncbi:MAG TPA: DUF72 domain-containing protein [Gaiella sp.]|uniref:DUF72 domain-containing protein n=1 Tax=Gaiella sp. TaxID=2663207 RepID=UPI002D806412|nr:DUF72 domain-containing protein [Gaiella sp.]HET9287502.1 DUF72 domain-containing protein [Gaiella sp.]